MASESTTTTDHDEIRNWVKRNDGTPACVLDTSSEGSTFFNLVNH
ncbi:hypothetical protein [Dietzia aurantiaca]|uniref:Uncharacterized protein n=1 Tax=Dietzia aurantiaca TaxID=983873 RepID=A0ABV9PUG1_9ACTN